MKESLKKIWDGWKKVAAKIAHFQGHLLLGILYYVVVGPTAILFRLLNPNPFSDHPKPASSYWRSRTRRHSADISLNSQF